MSYTPVPIGVDDFGKIITNGYYYIDKTAFIKELLDKKSEVNLFTRPRRFGKTLNLSMLKYFFEKPIDGKSNKHLFDGLKIMEAGEKYTAEQEQYPVIMLTLKSAKQANFNLAYKKLRETIASEFYRHKVILQGAMSERRKEKYVALMDETAEYSDYLTALAFLSECLYEYYHKKVIIFIDEYDVPLENAFYRDFYEDMTDFIRSLFESALKTNPYLEFSVITGCLRISKESIFTGLNNLDVISILNIDYGEYFGFTEQEVKEMLSFYHRENKMDIMKEWYDGYMFGNTEVYNPWSVINFVKSLIADENAFPTPAWSNTSSNNIIKELIYDADDSAKEEIQNLINGGTIEKKVHEDITYDDIHESEDNLWNFLFFTGYLKKSFMRMEGDARYITMAVPNREVSSIYRDKISNWFRDEIKVQDLTSLYKAMLNADVEKFQEEIAKQLRRTISYMDGKEAFYHGFLLGLMANLSDYRVKSNREAGEGRFDICVYNLDERIPPVILELKIADKYKELDTNCDKALKQIEEKDYAREWAEDGYTEVICYGVAFFRKRVRIKVIRMQIEDVE